MRIHILEAILTAYFNYNGEGLNSESWRTAYNELVFVINCLGKLAKNESIAMKLVQDLNKAELEYYKTNRKEIKQPMQPITKYICEICNTEYSTQEEALKCEKHHKPIKEIRYDYEPYYHDWNDGEPTHVTITFEDGNEVTYSL